MAICDRLEIHKEERIINGIVIRKVDDISENKGSAAAGRFCRLIGNAVKLAGNIFNAYVLKSQVLPMRKLLPESL